jgi:hypothetical protein
VSGLGCFRPRELFSGDGKFKVRGQGSPRGSAPRGWRNVRVAVEPSTSQRIGNSTNKTDRSDLELQSNNISFLQEPKSTFVEFAAIPARVHQQISSLYSHKPNIERNNMVSLANYGHRKEPALPSDIIAEKKSQRIPATSAAPTAQRPETMFRRMSSILL